MNLKNKLYGIPKIYYTNLDHRTDRREYMESQFDNFGIKSYQRISSSKYLSSEEKKWSHLILDDSIGFGKSGFGPAAIANSITHLEMIKMWLEDTNEDYMIMMEDDYDLSLIEYWNFDWSYLMSNIPQNWDCIQLGFENRFLIPFYLHPSNNYMHGFGPCLINRFYAEKLVRLHCVGDSFLLNIKINDFRFKKIHGLVDNMITQSGITYAIPLITNNPLLGSDYDPENKPRDWFYECRDLYYNWWKNEHHNYSLEDFFTYGKLNDNEMNRKLKNKYTFDRLYLYS